MPRQGAIPSARESDEPRQGAIPSASEGRGRAGSEELREKRGRSRAEEVRVTREGIELRLPGEKTWTRMTRSRLARDYPADHPVWVELRSHGLRRPSPSGPRPPDSGRERRLYALRLLPEDAARVDALARRLGLCRSALVVLLVTEVEVREKTAESG